MFDFTGGSFGVGDYWITIGNGGQTPYPGTVYPPVYTGGGYPVTYPVQQNNQLLMLGLIVLAFLVFSKR